MTDLKNYSEVLLNLPVGVKEAEVNVETHDIVDVRVEGGKTKVQAAKQNEFFLRVSGDKTGYFYTQDLNENCRNAIETALQNSVVSDTTEADEMNRSAAVCVCSDSVAEKRVDRLIHAARNFGMRLEKLLAARGMEAKISVRLKAETYGQHTINSHGLDVGFTSPAYILELEGQTPDEICYSLNLASSDLSCVDLETAAACIYNHLKWQENATGHFVSGDYPVILSEEAVYMLFCTAWQEFSGLKYLEHASQLSGKLGKPIAPPCLTIYDSVAMDGPGFIMPSDSEGTIGKDITLVENGVFSALLHNCRSAAASGAENTGNAGRRPLLSGNISTDILITPRNLAFVPGHSSLEELMANMGNGILITQYLDLFHTLDIASGNFSAPCYGVRIENGRPVENLKALTVSGNFLQMLGGIQEVGQERLTRPMVDLENYTISACALRVDRLNVSGEA